MCSSDLDNIKLTAKKVDKNRIETVTILLPEPGKEAQDESEDTPIESHETA